MQDARLRRHALGFWELAHKPSPQELAAYYANTYYQNQSSSYRKSYSALEAKIAAAEQHELVWLGNVLEHVLDPVGLLQSLRQLVSPGGLLVVTVPNDGSAYQEALLGSGAIPERFWIAVPDHISYFTADSLRHTTAATGWQCLALQGDFPIDLFLAHPSSNYVSDRGRGPAAHHARLQLEQLIGQAGLDPANRFYNALADVGLGRNLTAYLSPQTEAPTA